MIQTSFKQFEKMASYFDEHNCEPLGPGQQPNHMLHLARLLLDTGVDAEWAMQLADQMGIKQPPTSAEVLANLPDATKLRNKDDQCPVCLAIMKLPDRVEVTPENAIKELPCSHQVDSTWWTLYLVECPSFCHDFNTYFFILVPLDLHQTVAWGCEHMSNV